MIVILLGAPGSGKGTQARLGAERFGHYHIDTGRHGERLIYDPRNGNNPEIQERRKEFEQGLLFDPRWTLAQVSMLVQKYGNAGIDIVFSGSPRTLFEFSGDAETPGLIHILEKYYGNDHIAIFQLAIPHEESIRRNTGRLLCSVCGIQYMSIPKCVLEAECPFCGGLLRKRTLDTEEAMRVRLTEYTNRTEPIFKELAARGYAVRDINGEGLPHHIHETIAHQITARN